MLNALEQSKAATLYVGQVLDPDGNLYASAVIGDFKLVKNGTRADFNASAALTYDTNGHYAIAATASDTATLGQLTVICVKAGYVMPPARYQVVPQPVFDALVSGTDLLNVDANTLNELL